MKSSHTFAILFWINKSRIIDGKAELFARVTVDGRRTNLGLKRKNEIKLWDNKAKRVFGSSETAREINNHIKFYQLYSYGPRYLLKFAISYHFYIYT